MKDLLIIGAGPAGLTAAIYGKRAGLDTINIEESPIGGGQVTTTYEVDNYPGLPHIGGMELGEKMKEHALNMGAEFLEASVSAVAPKDGFLEVTTDAGAFESRAIIIATGAAHNHLGIPGEEELAGMGVSYCATCDGAFFKNRTVAVVGGGDVALEDALFLARTCKEVYLIHRRDTFRGAYTLAQAVKNTPNIKIIYNSAVEAISGEDMVESISVKNLHDGSESELSVNGIFIAVGTHPITECFEGLVKMDESGYILAGEDGVTSAKGIFVAGDARSKKLRQIITAAADGANAVNSACEYLNSLKKPV